MVRPLQGRGRLLRVPWVSPTVIHVAVLRTAGRDFGADPSVRSGGAAFCEGDAVGGQERFCGFEMGGGNPHRGIDTALVDMQGEELEIPAAINAVIFCKLIPSATRTHLDQRARGAN